MAGTGDGVRLDGGVSEGLPMRRDSAQGHAVVIGQDPLPPVAQLGPLHSASPACTRWSGEELVLILGGAPGISAVGRSRK